MTTHLSLLLIVATSATAQGPSHRGPLLSFGGDPGPGLLVNRTVGLRPFDPPDPSRPTVVFIQGFNPAPRLVHFTMAEGLAGVIAARFGPGAINVLEWNWNAATFAGVRPSDNTRAALDQGEALARAIQGARLDVGRLHIVAHSAGGIVAAMASRSIARRGGPVVAHLTFLDPAGFYHDVIFDGLDAASSARRVENYWVPGPSAYGRHVERPGVVSIQVNGRTPLLGVIVPTRSGHFDVVRWYADTVADPRLDGGFNASLLIDP